MNPGVDAAHTYFSIENPSNSKTAETQFQNWLYFTQFLALKDADGNDLPSPLVLQNDGSYRISLIDACTALLQISGRSIGKSQLFFTFEL